MKKTENQVDKKIRDAVICLMRDKDVSEITVAEVTKLTEISRTTFYRYYDSVDDVVKKIGNDLLDMIREVSRVELMDSTLKGKYVGPTQSDLARAEVLYENAAYNRAVMGPHGDPQFKSKAMRVMREGMRERYGDKLKEMEYDDFLLEFILAGNLRLIEYWLGVRPDISPKEFYEIQYVLYAGLEEFFHIS